MLEMPVVAPDAKPVPSEQVASPVGHEVASIVPGGAMPGRSRLPPCPPNNVRRCRLAARLRESPVRWKTITMAGRCRQVTRNLVRCNRRRPN